MSNLHETIRQYTSYIDPYKSDLLKTIKFEHQFTKAEGSYLYDTEGTAYLDFVSGFGTCTLGHYNTELMQLVADYLVQQPPLINPWGIHSEPAALAERLTSLTNEAVQKVYFASSGAEAIDSALKFSIAYTQQTSFIAVKKGFHGLTLATTSLSDNSFWHDSLPKLQGHVDFIEINNIDELRTLVNQNSYAAIILEPIQGSSGEGAWVCERLLEVQDIANCNNIVLILDEVMTGLGRSGNWFAYQTICPTLQPDIIVTSKGLTAGLIPLSAVLMKEPIYQAMFADSNGQNHAATFTGNGLATFCGLSVLSIVEKENLHNHARVMGVLLKKLLGQLKKEGLPIGNINATGLCITFQIVIETQYQTNAIDICLQLLTKNILTSVTPHDLNYIRITPPLNTNESSLHLFIETLRSCFHVD